ncbi:MAG: hypothetical protein JWM86_278 [Thermoleophilia bacterium]|nr:hypothetical protein [Thermoleophilia bacterium]
MLGGPETMLLYGAGSTVGPDASFYAPTTTLLLEAAAISAAPASAYVAQPAPATTAGGGIGEARTQALMSGAAPANEAERAWVAQTGQALQGYIASTNARIAAAAQQATLGRDALGRPTGGVEDHPWEQRVLELVNAERAKAGLVALAYDAQLDAAAEGHTARQAAVGVMAHDGIGDGDPGSRIRATGFTRAWGENVATGQLSPEQVVAEWMASPGHRRNIMDPDFRRLGVSAGQSTTGRTYWSQSFGA